MGNPNSSDQLHQYWHEHITACRDSGESAAAYCERRQLVYHRFIYWRQKFRDQGNCTQLAPPESAGFVRVGASHCDSHQGLSLALPNGLVIQEIDATNVNLVRQLLAVL